jgi:hypothetical protein
MLGRKFYQNQPIATMKKYIPQRHREQIYLVNSAAGAVNKIKTL